MYNTFLCIFGKYWPSKHTKINSFPFWMGFATDNSHVPVMYSHKQIMFEIVLLYLLAIFPLSRYWNPLLQHTSYHHLAFVYTTCWDEYRWYNYKLTSRSLFMLPWILADTVFCCYVLLAVVLSVFVFSIYLTNKSCNC